MTRVDDLRLVELSMALTCPTSHVVLVGSALTRGVKPPLLEQLRATFQDQQDQDQGNGPNRPATSKMPVGSETSLSLVIEVETSLARIVNELGGIADVSQPTRNQAWIQRATQNANDETVVGVAFYLDAMKQRVEEQLGVIEPHRTLYARCPGCGALGQIHILKDGDLIAGAICAACDAQWGRHQLGQLNSQINHLRKKSQ